MAVKWVRNGVKAKTNGHKAGERRTKKAVKEAARKAGMKPKLKAKPGPVPKITAVWQPPPMADKVLNPDVSRPKKEISISMHAIMGSSPNVQAYKVAIAFGVPIYEIDADGHEVTPEGRLVLRKGFQVVAIFNSHNWSHFRLVQKEG